MGCIGRAETGLDTTIGSGTTWKGNLLVGDSGAGAFVLTGAASPSVTTKGYGETQPVASNKAKAGRAKNRRIVAHFTCE